MCAGAAVILRRVCPPPGKLGPGSPPVRPCKLGLAGRERHAAWPHGFVLGRGDPSQHCAACKSQSTTALAQRALRVAMLPLTCMWCRCQSSCKPDRSFTTARARMQEAALPEVIAWALKALEASRQSGSGLEARPVDSAVAVVGHSRGGDVAYHQLMLHNCVAYAVLIDPVRQPHRLVQPTAKSYSLIGALEVCCVPQLRALRTTACQAKACKLSHAAP